MRVIFLGTPEFAVPSLHKLISDESIEVLAVITQPDKPVGRKKTLTAPPVKTFAEDNGLTVYQPSNISKDEELLKVLKELNPDYFITVAYGQILRQHVLDLAPNRFINVHASLLPAYRGPAPINWMIINGDKTVGVSTMETVLEVDAGGMLLEAESPLGENETAGELSERLSKVGADLLVETLHGLDTKNLATQEQVYSKDFEEEHKLAPFMDKKLGEIDFTQDELVLGSANPRQKDFKVIKKMTAKNIHNLVRGLDPWPGAYFMHGEQSIKILKTRLAGTGPSTVKAGQVSEIKDTSFVINTHDGLLEILELKPAGKNQMDAKSWINGSHLDIGDYLK